jgi:hypothetical protein
MKIKSLLLAASVAFGLLFNTVTGLAGDVHNFKVRYTLSGLSQQIIVAAESTSDARTTVQSLFPEATVYSAIKVHH